MTSAKISRPTYFAALDGFRGVLAICVAIFHTFWYSHFNATTFFINGAVIIDLFFVFSGFLMYRLYHNKLNTPEEAGIFLKRRFARLYPIHILMLGVFIAYAGARVWAHKIGISVDEPGEILPFHAGSDENWYNVLTHLTMTNAMGLSDSLTFNPPSWTISTEFFSYFVFLLMYLRCPPTKARHFALLAMGVILIYFMLSRVKPNMNITYDLGFFRCLAGFYTGLLASWVYGLYAPKAREFADKQSAAMTVLEVCTLSAFVAFVIYMPGKLQFFVAPFSFAFVLVFSLDGGLISRFMSLSIFRYFAKISYSIYIIHAIFAMTFYIVGSRIFPAITEEGNWAGDLFLIPYLVCVCVSAHLTWRFIEIPGQVLLQRIEYTKLFERFRKASV